MKENFIDFFEECLNSWDIDDIYAISFLVENEEDDPLRPTVIIGYNTESQVLLMMDNASELQARWNFAFWEQNNEFVFGVEDTRKMIERWINRKGIVDDLDQMDDEAEEAILAEFFMELIDIVNDIHQVGILTKKLGKEIPIIIHQLEYNEDTARYNELANGEILPESFRIFCEN